MEILGIVGSLCFAFCLLPQVVATYRHRDARALSWAFIGLSLGGNVFSCAYVLHSNIVSGSWQYPLYFNYGFALSMCIMLAVAKARFGK